MEEIISEGLRLSAHYARPSTGAKLPTLLLLPGFPRGTGGAAMSGNTYPLFADRIARDAGWAAMTFQYRGTGSAEGDFSIDGWISDVGNAVEALRNRPDTLGVWLAGFRLGGTLAIAATAADPLIRGIATFGAPANLSSWVPDSRRFAEYCRRVGVIQTNGYPSDVAKWGRSIVDLDVIGAAALIGPRSWMLVHGSHDLHRASQDTSELRVIEHGAHRLRHDPRAIAMLLGWLDRQLV
jgi:uncharacterized protein